MVLPKPEPEPEPDVIGAAVVGILVGADVVLPLPDPDPEPNVVGADGVGAAAVGALSLLLHVYITIRSPGRTSSRKAVFSPTTFKPDASSVLLCALKRPLLRKCTPPSCSNSKSALPSRCMIAKLPVSLDTWSENRAPFVEP